MDGLNVNVNQRSCFETGKLEGMMKAMTDNNCTALGVFDEFATFNDSIDHGATGSFEKSCYLTLFNTSNWFKKTKTNWSMSVNEPRF